MSIGELICQKRKEKGLTQKELSEILHLSSSAISKWEKENAVPHVSMYPQIAKALDLSIEELYGTMYQDTDEGALSTETIVNECKEPEAAADSHARGRGKIVTIIIVCVILVFGLGLLVGVVAGMSHKENTFSGEAEPYLEVVDSFYQEENHKYKQHGYEKIYVVIIEFDGTFSDEYIQEYKKEAKLTYQDKLEEVGLVCIMFYDDYKHYEDGSEAYMKLVLLPDKGD